MKLSKIGFVILAVFFGAHGCNYSISSPASEAAPGLVNTWAAKTLDAIRYVATPSFTLSPSLTLSPTISAIPTVQVVIDLSATPTITLSKTPVPSLTPLYRTVVPSSDFTLIETDSFPDSTSNSETSTPCNSAQFMGDVTIPDGFAIPVGLPFTKVWRIKNIGSCTWDTNYTLAFISGDRMKGVTTTLPKIVKPNETTDIPLNLTSPTETGEYKGNWMLRAGQITFGSGSGGTRPFFVQIEAIPNSKNIVFNFAVNFCAARWESDAGDHICPGKEGDPNGFITLLHKAVLETRSEDEPTLWMQPSDAKGGWISGTFPAIEIQHGSHFQADIGCLAGFEKCNVTFELWYRLPNSPKKKLGTWQEFHDRHLTHINIDLSLLSGMEASFTLLVIANNYPDQAAAFWLMPQIRLP